MLVNTIRTAFIRNRLIFDDIQIVYELIHALKNRRIDREGYVAMKLDIIKAYERVEWIFLITIM